MRLSRIESRFALVTFAFFVFCFFFIKTRLAGMNSGLTMIKLRHWRIKLSFKSKFVRINLRLCRMRSRFTITKSRFALVMGN